MIYLKLALGLLLIGIFGRLISSLFLKENKLSWLEELALSYLIGQGGLTLLLFFLFLLPVSHRVLIVTLMVTVWFMITLSLNRKKITFNPPRIPQIKKISLALLILIILIGGLAFKISYVLVEACSKPEYSWDAAGNWTDAGKNYFYAEKQWPQNIVLELKNTVNGYPRAISLLHYWLFAWMDEANDQWSKIIFPLELICLLIICYSGLKPIRGQTGALVFTYLLCSAPLFIYHATVGYADLTKTVYFAAGIIYFYRWLATKQTADFWFFGILLAFTSWMKLEGKALYAIGLVLLLVYLWRGCGESFKKKIFYAAKYLLLFILIGLPWQLFIMFNRLPDPQGLLSLSFSRFFEFHQTMYNQMFLGGSWGVFWVLAVAAGLIFYKRQLNGSNLYLLLTILLFYGNLLFIYLFFHNAVSEMVLTFNRVLLPLYPVVVFSLGCLIPKFKINREIEI